MAIDETEVIPFPPDTVSGIIIFNYLAREKADPKKEGKIDEALKRIISSTNEKIIIDIDKIALIT